MTCKEEIESIEEGFLVKFKDNSQIFIREKLLKGGHDSQKILEDNHYSTEEKEGQP